jgi:protein arginine kinase activator
MLCECCQEQEATIHVTQVADGKARELHLCAACAEEHGLDLQQAMSLPEMLLGVAASVREPGGPDKTCPHCHLRQSDFKKSGRLGCPRCYETFAEELAPMLASMHRGQRHAGKTPGRQAGLQRQLDAAVQAENYEEAARLRDRLKEQGA